MSIWMMAWTFLMRSEPSKVREFKELEKPEFSSLIVEDENDKRKLTWS